MEKELVVYLTPDGRIICRAVALFTETWMVNGQKITERIRRGVWLDQGIDFTELENRNFRTPFMLKQIEKFRERGYTIVIEKRKRYEEDEEDC